MSGIQQVEFQIFEIALIRVGAIGRENIVILAPNDKRWRLVLAKICLPLGVVRHVALVVIKQGQLDGRIALAL